MTGVQTCALPITSRHFWVQYLTKGCKFEPRCKYCTQKCLEAEPPLTEVGPNHLVRCFYAEKAVRQQNAK